MNELNVGSWLESGEKLPDGWRETTWGDVLHERVERAWAGDELLSVTAARGVIRQSQSAKRDTSSADKSNYRRVFVDDLVYNTMRMWQGVSSRSPFDGIVSPAYTVCIARTDQILPAYAGYLLKHPRSVIWFHRFAQGLVNDTLNLKYPTFARLPIIVPLLEEQRAIVRVLDVATMAVNTARTRVAKMRRLQDGLLHDLLSRGLDENGQLRDPETQPEAFRQSDLGLIPRDWKLEQLHSVVPSAEYGVSISTTDEFGVPVLRMNNIKDGKIEVSNLKFTDYENVCQSLLVVGDVLFNRTNSFDLVGKSAVWRGELEEASFASYLVRLAPDVSRLTPLYLSLWLNFTPTHIRIQQIATTAVQQTNVNPTNLRRLMIPLPSKPEQERITARMDEMESRVLAAQELLAKRETLLRALRDDLLTGGTRVSTELLTLVQSRDLDDAPDVAAVEEAFGDAMDESEIEALEVSA